jgi:hypothetical protein
MYTVDFVGLVCFSRKDGKGRMVLLPDGRNPGAGIDAHIPRLVVATDRLDGIDGVLETEVIEDATVIVLPKCSLSFSDADTEKPAGTTLDTARQDPFVPRLSDIDPNFDADETAAVVRLRIRRGALRAFRNPGSSRNDPAIVSRLEVPAKGMVTITVKPDGNGNTVKIRLKAAAEIVLANAARRLNPLNNQSHFLIYERLAKGPVNLSNRPTVRGGRLAALPSTNPFFRFAGGIGASGDCTNTGCCPGG